MCNNYVENSVILTPNNELFLLHFARKESLYGETVEISVALDVLTISRTVQGE